MKGYGRFRRAAALAAFAVFGAMAAFASIAPGTDAALRVAKAALHESIKPPSALLPAPTTYLREERFAQGETVASLLARLGVAESDARLLFGTRQVRLLRAGSVVTAQTRAGEKAGELVWLQFPVS